MGNIIYIIKLEFLQIFLYVRYLQIKSIFQVSFEALFCNIALLEHICKKFEDFFAYIIIQEYLQNITPYPVQNMEIFCIYHYPGIFAK